MKVRAQIISQPPVMFLHLSAMGPSQANIFLLNTRNKIPKTSEAVPSITSSIFCSVVSLSYVLSACLWNLFTECAIRCWNVLGVSPKDEDLLRIGFDCCLIQAGRGPSSSADNLGSSKGRASAWAIDW